MEYITLEIKLTKAAADAAQKKADQNFGKGNVSEYFEWLIRGNCKKEIRKLEKGLDKQDVKVERSKPKVLTTSEMDAGSRTECEICGLPIQPKTRICKGIYDDGTKTEHFVHRTCCDD